MTRTRRNFLNETIGTSALVSMSATVPSFLRTSIAAAGRAKGDKVLVVVQLTGGNDGLNTVVPYADDAYARARGSLRIAPGAVLKIDDYHGLHPQLTGLFDLLQENQLSILQGVGYAKPNRSHFESMDIWHTCRRDMTEGNAGLGGRRTGWLGRFLDTRDIAGGDMPAVHIGGGRQPLALAGESPRAISVNSPDAFRLNTGGDASLRSAIEAASTPERDDENNDLLGFLRRSSIGALASSQRVQDALSSYSTPVQYPGSGLARQLRTVAQLIEAGMGTRVYYVELGGFDTHANQAPQHNGLMQQLGDAVAAFMKDVTHHGHAERVLLMTFSEFGRRVKENASQGTDHGTAAPLFLAGGRVRPGLIGDHPSLTDLDQGDLKHHTDFRRVYASVLRDWLGVKSTPVLLGEYAPLPLVRS